MHTYRQPVSRRLQKLNKSGGWEVMPTPEVEEDNEELVDIVQRMPSQDLRVRAVGVSLQRGACCGTCTTGPFFKIACTNIQHYERRLQEAFQRILRTNFLRCPSFHACSHWCAS